MKKEINPLFIAAGTLVFYMAGIPLIDSVSTYLQNLIGKTNVKLMKEIQELQDEEKEEEPVRAVGFHVDSEPEEVEWKDG